MNILICDANESDTKNVETILEYSYGSKMKTMTFHKADDARAYIRSGANVDICFLETVTPEMDGIELARTLRADGHKGEIAFLTESKRYGPEAYEVKAITYLLKPMMPEQIREVVRKVGYKQKRTAVRSPEIYNTVETFPHHKASRLGRVKLFLQKILLS